MELKVWVEGIQRIVCGVTDVTTCQDVVYALAHATGKTGRFTLMERWRNSERLLAPQEHPLKILLKWGEYASDVQFILQRTALQPKGELLRPEVGKVGLPGPRPPPPLPGCPQRVGPKAAPDPPSAAPQSPPQGRDIKKSLTFSGGHSPHLEGAGGAPMLHPAEVGGVPLQGIITKVPPYPHPPPILDTGPSRAPYSTRAPFAPHRPPAPPPYELVRGHPPPPPPSMVGRPLPSYPPLGPPKDRRPMRSPPPYPTPFRGPRPPRELPPYRDPPPPPPPSHPALVKIVAPSRGPGLLAPPSGEGTPLPRAPIPSPQGGHKSSGAPDKARKEEPRRYREREEVPRGPPSPPEPHLAPVSEPSHGSEERAWSPPLKGPRESPLLDNSLNGEDGDGPEGDINSNLIPSVLTRPTHKSSVALNKVLRESGGPKRITSVGSPSPIRAERDKAPGTKASTPVGCSPSNNNNHHPTEEVVLDGYYRELVKLVNDQREKICAQQVDLTKFEAEIAFKEGRWKEEESRLAYIQEEIQRLDRDPDKPVQNVDMKLLTQLEEQLKVAKKAESSSKQEIEDIRKKIAACDHQLEQLHSRIRSIQESLREEESAQRREEQEQEALQREVDKLQVAVGQAEEQAEEMQKVSHQLALEMSEAEGRLEEKRREVDALKHAMREVNLEALSMSPAEEANAPSEAKTGNHKGGSNRRMVGSPRQLETAVPTSKNPHGVWV